MTLSLALAPMARRSPLRRLDVACYGRIDGADEMLAGQAREPVDLAAAELAEMSAAVHDADGIDRTLIRWMLDRTPRERIEAWMDQCRLRDRAAAAPKRSLPRNR